MTVSIDDYREIQLHGRFISKSSGCEAAIHYIQSILDRAKDEDLRCLLLSDLAMYYTKAEMPEDAESAIRQAAEERPNDPLPWCTLASHHHHTRNNPDNAVNFIETALQKAKAQGALIRHVLAQRINIALDRKDYATVEDSLVQILEAPRGPDIRDVRLEDYFLDKIPPGTVDGELLERYRAAVTMARSRSAEAQDKPD